MPVRIYDIARKLGIESKEVLAKAKELGIQHAKVASSTLDKITAEYLEQRLGPPRASVVESAPAPPLPTEPAAPTAPIAPPAPLPEVSVPQPPPIAPPPTSPPPEILPVIEPLPPVPAVEAPVEVRAEPPAVFELPTVAPVEVPPPEPPPAPTPVIEQPPHVTHEPVAPTMAPPASTAPKAPGLGELVGRIELPNRYRVAGRLVSTAPPAPVRKVEPARGRGPAPAASPRAVPGAPARPAAPAAKPVGQPQPAPAGARPGGKPMTIPEFTPPADGPLISLKPPVVVRDLADKVGVKAFKLIADLMDVGVFASVNQAIDEKVAQYVAFKHGFRFELEKREKGAGQVHAPVRKVELDVEDRTEELKPRAPVITIMGHVDHGKTTLLDVIRKSDVAAREAGGITQHIGAYTIQVPHPERPKDLQQLTFLDTPGHAAFSAMRARGANVTDLVILVVAASEGVMPQTVEALNHARAAKVPILVAVNKSDLPAANPTRVRQELQEQGLVCEEWGGETIFVDVSAATRKGIDQLLAMLVLQAEVMELKANPARRAKGNVIESGLEPGGPTATVLVRKGTLRLGDIILCGQYYGRVRALINEEGERLKEAGPSVAVKVLGLNGVPEAGLEFSVVENDKAARALAGEREQVARSADREKGPRVTIENLFKVLEQESAKVLKLVVKADTQGSVEAIVEALKKTESTKVSLEIVHSAVGTITENDVLLAASAKGMIVGFHTRMDNGVPAAAKRESVPIKQYEIIYELIDEVRNAMTGLLEPELKEVVLGTAEVRQIFQLSKGGRAAGCMVINGRIVKGKARVLRRKETIHDGVISTLHRYQDEVSEVRAGMECGIRVSNFDDFETGDLIETYTFEKVAQKL